MPQTGMLRKTNGRDGYKAYFAANDIRLDDLPGSSDVPVHFERNAAALGQRSKD
jgi:hypothetical protein